MKYHTCSGEMDAVLFFLATGGDAPTLSARLLFPVTRFFGLKKSVIGMPNNFRLNFGGGTEESPVLASLEVGSKLSLFQFDKSL